MAKNNIRSVRFSDEQVGDNFTQKFERLVYNCYMLLPEKERQTAELDKRITEKRESLNALKDRYYKAAQFLGQLDVRLRELDRLFDAQS